MSTRFATLCLLLLTVSLAACSGGSLPVPETISGSGTLITETREVSDFSRVTFNGVGQLFIEQTGAETLSITADDNFMPYLESTVRGKTLTVGITDNVLLNSGTHITMRLTVRSLDQIALNGAGSIEIDRLDTDRLQVQLSGTGSISVAGQAAHQSVTLDGAGSYEAAELDSETAEIVQNGAGVAAVRVSDELTVEINGMGSVEYIGSPTVRETINGIGSVRQRS